MMLSSLLSIISVVQFDSVTCLVAMFMYTVLFPPSLCDSTSKKKDMYCIVIYCVRYFLEYVQVFISLLVWFCSFDFLFVWLFILFSESTR